ncbi:MAG: type 2 isopentenyl-diphosphate Delta-isomerase [Thermoplasmatota archaeon]
MTIEKRKDDHIRICLEKDVQVTHNHWDDVLLLHQSVPECDLDSIDLTTEIMGRKLKAPLVISSMTGGSPRAKEINEVLARAASEFGIGMGVGSQRAGIEKRDRRDSYAVVKEYDVPLMLSNLGAPQFAKEYEGGPYGLDQVMTAMEMVGAHAACIHFNYLQEMVQPEGDTYIDGVLENLIPIAGELPLIAKETGAGTSREAALKFKEAGFKAIDVGGASGTSFAAVESFRGGEDEMRTSRLGNTFWNWGIPTPVSIILSKVGLPLIATGGVRNGQDAVKALSMGASAAGMAWHLLIPASRGYGELKKELSMIISEVRAALFLSGAPSASHAEKVKYLLKGQTLRMTDQLRR